MSYLTCVCVCVHRNCLRARSHPAHARNCTFPLDSRHCGWHGRHRCGGCISQVSFQTSFPLVGCCCCVLWRSPAEHSGWDLVYAAIHWQMLFTDFRIARMTIFQFWLPPAMRRPHAIFGAFTSISGCWPLGKEIVSAEDSPPVNICSR